MQTVQLGLGTVTELFHHSAVSSTPSGGSVWCSCNLSGSFLNGSCGAYASHLGSDWYEFALSFTCKEKCFEALIPVKISLNIL